MLFPVTEISYTSSDVHQHQGAQTSRISFSLQDQIHKAKANEKNPNCITFSAVSLWKVARRDFFPPELYFVNVSPLLAITAGYAMTVPPKTPASSAELQSETFLQRRTFFPIRCHVGLLWLIFLWLPRHSPISVFQHWKVVFASLPRQTIIYAGNIGQHMPT